MYASDGQQLREHKQRLHNLNRSFAKAAGNQVAEGTFSHSFFVSSAYGSTTENPEINPMIVTDPAYEDDVDDDAADIGIRFGKLRISDRIGGLVRPKVVEEVCYFQVPP